MLLGDASLVVTDRSTKKRKSSKHAMDLREVADRWNWLVDLVKTVTTSKRFSVTSRPGTLPTYDVLPRETSTRQLQGVLARPTVVAMTTIIMEEMRDVLLALLEVEDAAVDEMMIEDVCVQSVKGGVVVLS